jgi:hypothetical protein
MSGVATCPTLGPKCRNETRDGTAMTLPFWNYPPKMEGIAMMKLAVAAAMLMASLLTISVPADACGYRNAGTAKVYGWSGRRAVRRGYRRGRVYGSRAYAGRRIARRNRVNRRRWR